MVGVSVHALTLHITAVEERIDFGLGRLSATSEFVGLLQLLVFDVRLPHGRARRWSRALVSPPRARFFAPLTTLCSCASSTERGHLGDPFGVALVGPVSIA